MPNDGNRTRTMDAAEGSIVVNKVRESKGSWANVEELSQTPGVGLAIVQSDVYAAFVYLRDSPQVPSETRSASPIGPWRRQTP